MIVASYHTDGTYRALAERMAASAEAVGLRAVIYAEEDRGEWRLNANRKPEVVARAMAEYEDDVLFVDADAEFRRLPLLLFEREECDLGVFFRSARQAWDGTVLVRRTAEGRRALERWRGAVRADPSLKDGESFAGIVRGPNTRLLRLPPAYYWVEQWMRRVFPKAEPVIEHRMVHTIGERDARRLLMRRNG